MPKGATGFADGWGIDDRERLLEVVDNEPVEQRFVPILKPDQVDVLLQRIRLAVEVPDDPLFPFDPIYNSVPAQARGRLVSRFDLDLTVEGIALGFRFDIVLRGRGATPFGV